MVTFDDGGKKEQHNHIPFGAGIDFCFLLSGKKENFDHTQTEKSVPLLWKESLFPEICQSKGGGGMDFKFRTSLMSSGTLISAQKMKFVENKSIPIYGSSLYTLTSLFRLGYFLVRWLNHLFPSSPICFYLFFV